MKVQVFAVHDDKAQAYLPPFVMHTRGQAIRAFTDSINDASTPFYKHPGDYRLYHLGEWDDSTGLYQQADAPMYIVSGGDLTTKEKKP